MDTLQAILLGIVQGITEFLPVSSSGHLQIAKELLGVRIEDNLTFDVMLHAGTVLSTLVVLHREVWRLLKGLFSRRFNEEQAYVLKIVVSMIPIGIVGLLLVDRINALLEAPYILVVVGAMLLLTAALLTFAYYARPRQKETISYRDAFLIGLAQAAAAMPGLSRSGSTIATGLLLGNKKAVVAQFSFLMVLAPIIGQTLLEMLDAGGLPAAGIGAGTLAAGFAASFLTGCLACKGMIEVVKRGKLIWFAVYCALAGIVSIYSYLA
ncbi:undecaprenyl-diphosphate phosphatase [Alistipes sp.]|uniref:undecaprenyl-diphosphate phosphatase n=1 Tax=Alistipes sp. TaxID=1872444 RepID=UPI003AF0C966